ncbi:MAG: glutaredoxin [Synechococcus sp.]|jgi:glutaredoxin|nr:glutaredoxin [Synechococcus sp.]
MALPDSTHARLDAVRLYRMDTPDHACPWGLRALELLREQGIPFEDIPLRSDAELEIFKRRYGVNTTPQVFSGQERIGGYSDLAARLGAHPDPIAISYTPVIAVFGTAALVALALGAGIGGFLGLSVCLLAMLKLIDVSAFAASFIRYDLLSQRWRPWSRLYPTIELLVGLGMLAPLPAGGPNGVIAGLAVALGLAGMVSVGKAVFVDHMALHCACVGGNSKTPLGLVSFAENLIMAGMGAAMFR